MAGRKDHATEGFVLADHVGGGWRGKNAALSHHDTAKTVGGCDLDKLLDHLAVIKASVAANHERLALEPLQHVEDRLDEIFCIIGLLENRNLLAQARSARLLILVWRGRNGLDGHVVPVRFNRLAPCTLSVFAVIARQDRSNLLFENNKACTSGFACQKNPEWRMIRKFDLP